MIRAYWYLTQNFGDALNPWIIEKITGEEVIWADVNSSDHKFMVTGSILNAAKGNVTVWGCGLGRIDECVNPDINIKMVRGPISCRRCRDEGHTMTDVWGDPALLIPAYHIPKVPPDETVLGIVPHYVDQEAAWELWGDMFRNGSAKFINVIDPIEKVIDDIYSCEHIFSSSLHGLIVADAYQKKTSLFKLTDKIEGDGMKFTDHTESIKADPYVPVDIHKLNRDARKDYVNVDKMIVTCKNRNAVIDIDRMLYVCPFQVKNKPMVI